MPEPADSPHDGVSSTYSIVVPAFNAATTLARAVHSVQAQTLGSWRLVIVDDGSTDQTCAIADRLAETDPRITVVHQPNSGVAAARNAGVAATAGTLVAFLDADDELSPEYLSSMDSFTRTNPGYDIYHPNLWVVGGRGGDSLFSSQSEPVSLGFEDLLEECVIAVGGSLITRELFERMHGFQTGIHCEDYDFWLRATAAGAKALLLPKPLYSYHQEHAGRRSEDAWAGMEGVVCSLTLMLDRGEVPNEYVDHVKAVIATKRGFAARVAQEQEMAEQADRFRSAVESAVGKRAATPILAVLHSVTWIVRPVRRAIAARRAVAFGRDELIVPSSGIAAQPSVLVIPSWYPSASDSTAGIFIQQQVRAVSGVARVAVLHVNVRAAASLESADEGGVRVFRVGLASNSFNRLFGVRRAGKKAFETISETWGVPDIVHVQALWPAAGIARYIKRRYGIPYVVTEHSEEYLAQSSRKLVKYPLVVRTLLRPLARGASRTITVSRFLADRLVELGLAEDPIVIPNVVPVVQPTPRPSTPPFGIAHVSVMGPAKNVGSLLRAVRTLRTRRADFAVRLVGDGECRSDLESLAASLGVGDLVEFTGRKSAAEVQEIIAAAAFTVVSSTHETFSVSAAESLMSGRPVLSTRCGGPEEFITPEVGRLIPVDDVGALADGLDWMLDHLHEFDPMALHEYARVRFAPDVVARQILSVYREVLDD